MSATLAFSELVPERDRFELADGEVIEFMSMADLDAVDAARTMAIQKRIEGIQMDNLTEENAIKLNEVLADLIRIILPEMPEDILTGLKTGQRLMIIRFWSDHNKPGETKNGSGQA